MGLTPGTRITDIALDRVFIGSCTNSRIEDLRAAAQIVAGKTVHRAVNAMDRAGFGHREDAGRGRRASTRSSEAAGFDWREPGCSMCLAMNADRLGPEERCASTSNRNFEGRQGHKGRTHLVSPGHGGGGGDRRPFRGRAHLRLRPSSLRRVRQDVVDSADCGEPAHVRVERDERVARICCTISRSRAREAFLPASSGASSRR